MANGITDKGARIQAVSVHDRTSGVQTRPVALYDWSTGAPVAGSTSWGPAIQSWVFAGVVTEVDFPNLAGYQELQLVGFGLTSNTAGTDAPAVRTSTDNGATFAATGYESYGTNIGTSVPVLTAVAAGGIFATRCEMMEFNTADQPTAFDMIGQLKNSSTKNNFLYERPVELNNAIRVFWQNGAGFTGGRLRLHGRRSA